MKNLFLLTIILACILIILSSCDSNNKQVIEVKPIVKPIVYSAQNELNVRMHVYRIETDSVIVVFIPQETINAIISTSK